MFERQDVESPGAIAPGLFACRLILWTASRRVRTHLHGPPDLGKRRGPYVLDAIKYICNLRLDARYQNEMEKEMNGDVR